MDRPCLENATRLHPTVAMRWTPPGRRKRGRSRETWCQTTERDEQSGVDIWGQIQRLS